MEKKPIDKKYKLACSVATICFILLNYFLICLFHTMLYTPDVYTCRHMSRDIEDIVEFFRIPVKIIRAENYNHTKSHVWVSIFGIEFDSITLLPIFYSEYTVNKKIFLDYQIYLESKRS